jgi:hypothetical protein
MLAGIGCQDSRGPISVNSDDPDLQILAMKQDATTDARRDIPKMVEDLGSDDPAIRFYSIVALRELTHDDFGYHFYETDEERAPAWSRWKNWVKQQKLAN